MQRSHEWQVARKGITPIELATLKTEETLSVGVFVTKVTGTPRCRKAHIIIVW